MPMHDWTQVDDALFHSFHLSWASELSRRLNQELLPPSHFAITETIELRPAAGFLELPEPDRPYVGPRLPAGNREVSSDASRTRFAATDDQRQYACKAVTVRHADHHQPVAAIVWVTRQDKQTPYRLRALLQTAVGAITRGVHLLVIDLYPPTPRAPKDIHTSLWEDLTGAVLGFLPASPG
jgi:hypothetical protein